jgi:hypothetical protein
VRPGGLEPDEAVVAARPLAGSKGVQLRQQPAHARPRCLLGLVHGLGRHAGSAPRACEGHGGGGERGDDACGAGPEELRGAVGRAGRAPGGARPEDEADLGGRVPEEAKPTRAGLSPSEASGNIVHVDDPTQPSPPAVIIRPPTGLFSDEELGSLVLAINRETGLMADRVEFRLGYLYGDWSEPGWTWVNFVVDEAGRAAIRSLVNAIIEWGRDWIKKARERDPSVEPVKAVIYAPNGEVLEEVEVVPRNS